MGVLEEFEELKVTIMWTAIMTRTLLVPGARREAWPEASVTKLWVVVETRLAIRVKVRLRNIPSVVNREGLDARKKRAKTNLVDASTLVGIEALTRKRAERVLALVQRMVVDQDLGGGGVTMENYRILI